MKPVGLRKLSFFNFYTMLAQQPKKIFLLDACGALLTFFLLYLVGSWEALFGMPKEVLQPLSIIAVFFALYSFFCYAFIAQWRIYLKGIAVANMLYCVATLCCLKYNLRFTRCSSSSVFPSFSTSRKIWKMPRVSLPARAPSQWLRVFFQRFSNVQFVLPN